MNTNNNLHPIFLTKLEDDTFLAVSIDSPRFAVAGATLDVATAKAQRALDYYVAAKEKARDVKPREFRVISPVFEEKELCAQD